MQSQQPPPVLTRNIGGDPRIVGPVLQFSLFIVPIVINCFFMVYALAGFIIEGRDKLNWSLEAPAVGFWICIGMLSYSALVMAYVRFKGGTLKHLLSISSMVHAAIALALAVCIFMIVQS